MNRSAPKALRRPRRPRRPGAPASTSNRRRPPLPLLLAVITAAFTATARPLAGQEGTATLRVTVLEAGTERPVAAARVHAGSAGLAGSTDAAGVVRLDGLPVGVHAVSVAAPGFHTGYSLLSVAADAVAHATIRLDPDPIPLAGLEVRLPVRNRWLTMSGFYDRASGGLGTFLDPDDMARRAARSTRLSDVLRALPGIRVSPNTSAPGTYFIESRRGRISVRQRCLPAIWLDGVPLGRSASIDIDGLVRPSDLLAIEVYDGPADVPSGFRTSSNACGAIVMWTGGRSD